MHCTDPITPWITTSSTSTPLQVLSNMMYASCAKSRVPPERVFPTPDTLKTSPSRVHCSRSKIPSSAVCVVISFCTGRMSKLKQQRFKRRVRQVGTHRMHPGRAVSRTHARTPLRGFGTIVVIVLPPSVVVEQSGALEILSHRVWMSCASDAIYSTIHNFHQL